MANFHDGSYLVNDMLHLKNIMLYHVDELSKVFMIVRANRRERGTL